MDRRLGILNEFGVRLEQMNARHRRLALPAIDAPHGLKTQERIHHIRVLLDALEQQAVGARIDERLIVDLGAHAAGWLDAHRTRQEFAVAPGRPVAPVGDPEFEPVPPRDAA